jgi:hypothetical protein
MTVRPYARTQPLMGRKRHQNDSAFFWPKQSVETTGDSKGNSSKVAVDATSASSGNEKQASQGLLECLYICAVEWRGTRDK